MTVVERLVEARAAYNAAKAAMIEDPTRANRDAVQAHGLALYTLFNIHFDLIVAGIDQVTKGESQ